MVVKKMYYGFDVNTPDGFRCWSGARDTVTHLAEANLLDEAWDYIEEMLCGEVTDTELNDFIWFESESIYNAVGLDENGQFPEEEEIDDDDWDGEEDEN